MPPSPQRAFGDRIRELRLAAGMTQEDLADRCGLFRTYMSRIETGKANPTLTMICALATSLGVNVPSLFSGSEGVVTPRAVVKASRPSRGRADK